MPGVLLVTNEVLSGDSLDEVLRHLREGDGDPPPPVHVVSPALAESGLKHQMGDVDEARAPAQERLDRILAAFGEAGIAASGEVGDSDPVQAISDELQKFDPDRIVLIDHAREGEAKYAEKDLLERVDREFDPPATELRVAGGGSEVVERHSAPAGSHREDEGEVFSENLGPVRRQDGLGILVAILGTIVLFILAGACGAAEGEGQGFDIDQCGIVYLIAGAFFLVNLAHVGALLLMEGVGYRGPFERLFARVSLIGTPLAVAAAAAIVVF
jgi:hypothetical protein